MLTADAVIDVLGREGVSFLSCYPTTPLIDAAATVSLPPVICRQERVGVGIADGFSRMTNGRPPGVFAMQWGPGIENAYSGIATAYSDSVPVLLLPLGYEQERADAPRVFSADRLLPIAKSVERIRRPDDVGDVMRRAFSRLKNGRPGPVVVELPVDVARAPLSRELDYRVATAARAGGDPTIVDTAAALVAAADQPVILAGQGVLYAGASAELVELAELLDAGVATTLEGKSAFPEDHPLSLGTGSIAMSPAVRDFMAEADVVLAVGASLTRHLTAMDPPVGPQVIQITVDEADINKDCEVACPIVGDAKLVLAALIECVRDRVGAQSPGRGTAARISSIRDPWLEAWAPLLRSTERPINPYRVVTDLNAALAGRDCVVTHDSGSPRDQITPFYVARSPRSYLGWGKSHGLGTGLGLILGAKLARPDAVCVNVMGDAAFGMVGLDFETAVRAGIPILTIVMNNSTMAVESSTMRVVHERYRGRDIGGDYAQVARALGGWARRVEEPERIPAALAAAIRETEAGTPALLDVITSPVMTPFSCRLGSREVAEPALLHEPLAH